MIRPWEKIGDPEVIGSERGRLLLRQTYNKDGGLEDFVLYHAITRAVIIVAITPDNKIVATRQFRPGPNKILIELPGGNAEEEESLAEAVTRELVEETGYETSKIISLSHQEIFFDPSVFNTSFNPFLALHCVHKADTNPELEVMLVDLEKWLNMTMSGDIVDAKSLTATLMAIPQLKNSCKS